MKVAWALAAFVGLLALQGGYAGLFGIGIPGFSTVSVGGAQTALLPIASKPVLTTLTLPFSSVPLAPGLSLGGTTAYTKSSPTPSSDCITIALNLFDDCQPFLQTLINNGGQLSSITILQLLMTAQNKTASTQCFSATLNFLNQGCVCDYTTYTTLQSLPPESAPQLVKQTANILAKLMCPSGLVSPPPDAGDASATGSAGASTTPTSTSTDPTSSALGGSTPTTTTSSGSSLGGSTQTLGGSSLGGSSLGGSGVSMGGGGMAIPMTFG